MQNFIRRLFALGTIIFISLLAYGFYEPYTLKTVRYTLNTPELAGIKLVYATDFHIAQNDTKRLNKIISVINAEKPDIIILGGDYVKGHKKSSSLPIEHIADAFSHLKSPLGTYAVLGNHDHYYGKKQVVSAMQNAGITILDNDNRHLNFNHKEFTLAGVADYSSDKPDFIKTFKNAAAPAILITHSPDIFPISPKTALTLAGHTHGGQIRFPFIGAPMSNSVYGQHYINGLIRENGKTMIVSKGLGTSILPLRFNCSPEIVVITFN